MIGQTPPFYTPGGAFGVTGSPATGWTFNKTAETGVAETLVTFTVSDDSIGKFSIKNVTGSNGIFGPLLSFETAGSTRQTYLQFMGQTDSGTTSVVVFKFSTIAGAALSARPMLDVLNGGNTVLSWLPLNSGANMAMSWGTQSGGLPATAARTNGTRCIWYASFSAGTATDWATGISTAGNILWDSIPTATSSHTRAIYGGNGTLLHSVRGDGLHTTTGGRVVKTRSATATPVTVVAGTDEVIFCNVAASAAVAATLPANVAGQRFTFKDAIGTADVGNITITPTAGLIDGAATLVINTAYGKAELVGDGTNWFTV